MNVARSQMPPNLRYCRNRKKEKENEVRNSRETFTVFNTSSYFLLWFLRCAGYRTKREDQPPNRQAWGALPSIVTPTKARRAYAVTLSAIHVFHTSSAFAGIVLLYCMYATTMHLESHPRCAGEDWFMVSLEVSNSHEGHTRIGGGSLTTCRLT